LKKGAGAEGDGGFAFRAKTKHPFASFQQEQNAIPDLKCTAPESAQSPAE
jgi:hypothetical protein